MGHTWGYGNNLAIFPTQFSSLDVEQSAGNRFETIDIQELSFVFHNYWGIQTTGKNNCGRKSSKLIHAIHWETTLYNLNVRKLVNESCGTFSAIQKAFHGASQIKPAELVTFSHQVCDNQTLN